MIIKIQEQYYKLCDLQGREIKASYNNLALKDIIEMLLIIKEALNYAKDNIDDPYANISYNPIEAYEKILSKFNINITFSKIQSEDYIEL